MPKLQAFFTELILLVLSVFQDQAVSESNKGINAAMGILSNVIWRQVNANGTLGRALVSSASGLL